MNWLIEPRQQIDMPLNCGMAFGIIILCANIASGALCKTFCIGDGICVGKCTDLCVLIFIYENQGF